MSEYLTVTLIRATATFKASRQDSDRPESVTAAVPSVMSSPESVEPSRKRHA